MDLRGVVAADGSRAVYSLTQRTASTTYPSGRITLPGLLPDTRYRVQLSQPLNNHVGNGQSPLDWTLAETILSGRLLAATGLASPVPSPNTPF
ncbi:GH36 C-terminal domain-containing protein [Arthrobacter alpinus]|nr:GH36 C-terminal domain-containing protein [Arthrobacter alpinus]